MTEQTNTNSLHAFLDGYKETVISFDKLSKLTNDPSGPFLNKVMLRSNGSNGFPVIHGLDPDDNNAVFSFEILSRFMTRLHVSSISDQESEDYIKSWDTSARAAILNTFDANVCPRRALHYYGSLMSSCYGELIPSTPTATVDSQFITGTQARNAVTVKDTAVADVLAVSRDEEVVVYKTIDCHNLSEFMVLLATAIEQKLPTDDSAFEGTLELVNSAIPDIDTISTTMVMVSNGVFVKRYVTLHVDSNDKTILDMSRHYGASLSKK